MRSQPQSVHLVSQTGPRRSPFSLGIKKEGVKTTHCPVTAQNWYPVLGAKPLCWLLQFPGLTSERAAPAISTKRLRFRGNRGNWLGTSRQHVRQWERPSFAARLQYGIPYTLNCWISFLSSKILIRGQQPSSPSVCPIRFVRSEHATQTRNADKEEGRGARGERGSPRLPVCTAQK